MQTMSSRVSCHPAYIQSRSRAINFDPAMLSSLTDEWATLQDFFDLLHAEFHCALDVCAQGNSGRVRWCTPSYSRQTAKWDCETFLNGTTVVDLFPARRDTTWWDFYDSPFIPEASKCQ